MIVCSGRLPPAMQLGDPAGCGAAGVILQQHAGLVRHDCRAERMCDRIDEGADVAMLVDHGDVSA